MICAIFENEFDVLKKVSLLSSSSNLIDCWRLLLKDKILVICISEKTVPRVLP